MKSLAYRFLKEEGGHALVYFLVALPAFLGVSLLAIDIGRGNNLHYDLQKAVDSLALAAAAELDGSPGAIARAEARLTGLLANRSRFSDGGEVVLNASNVQARFLDNLPQNDDLPIPGSMVTTSDADAQFVEVTANAQAYTSIFPISLALGSDTVNISATAVAGFGSAVCDFTPMFICNPFETAGNREQSIQDFFAAVGDGRMITLRQQGGGQGQALPGNFGFLEPPTGDKGANGLRNLFAKVKPQACFSQRRVTTKPGFSATVTDAINVRFDLYDGPMNQNKGRSDYRPAKNVRKGYGPKGQAQGNPCNYEEQEDTSQFMKLPRDEILTEIQGGQLGDGMWDFEQYWNTNFPGQAGDYPNGWSNANPPPRFELYRYEIQNDMTSEASVGGEVGDPACYSGAANPDDNPDRRLVYGAIINCQEEFVGADGRVSGGKQQARPIAFGSFFLTEALEKGGSGGERDNQTIRTELVDVTGPDGNGSLLLFERNEAILYR